MQSSRAIVPLLLAAVTALIALPACEDKTAPAAVTPVPAASTATTAPPSPPASVAPSTSTAPSTPAAVGPRLTFDSVTHDFGAVLDSQKYSTSFRFTNTGTGKLVVYTVKTACGCTVATLTKTEFMPGEGSTIDVVFDPKGRSGTQTKNLSVISNTQPAAITKLSIRAVVRPMVQYKLFLAFGEIALGQSHTKSVQLFYYDPNLQITDLFATTPTVSARVVSLGRSNPVNGQPPYRATIEVTVAADTPWGVLFQTRVKFTARGEPSEGIEPVAVPYTLFVNGQIFGDLLVDPVLLTSKVKVGRGEPVTLSATLSRVSGAPFSVHDVTITESTMSGLSAHVKAISASVYEIVVEGVAPAVAGAVNGAVMVRTNVSGEDRLVLHFSMYVR